MTSLAYGLQVPGVSIVKALELMEPLSAISDEELGSLTRACCEACEREQDDIWQSVDRPPKFADLVTMLMVVVNENFGKLFALQRPKFDRIELPYSYAPVSLPDGQDWLWRPVHRGYYRGESLFDGTLRIEHIAMANMALDVSDENEARARKAAETVK